ncbi:uncharacterized protein LOC132745942 [Ruditapes philippinarum]|uniref:uncharacterized protein LOC132745942 n=1 Tax=Ruditapes philippinarum TaxID=129788 RepID=UPI00295B5F84|nr:uncharacterized protein LOC132745942 [Ruditapes philippinarum]
MSGKPYPTAQYGSGYPQQPQYPTSYPQPQYQTGYPYQQQYGQPVQPSAPYYGNPNPPPYQEAPPPYSQYQAGPPAPQPMYPQQMPPQQQTVIAPGLFDSGARFDGIAQQRVPPPPPGVAPSQAQLAAMQGHQVVGSQQGTSWISGGRNDGGYTWGF